MARRDLLPGVSPEDCPPAVVFDSARAIRRARRRAAIRDAAQLILLAGVDYLFMRWPLAHIPALGRDVTVLVVATLNSLILTHAMISRIFPRWAARRIASTWCTSERTRFFGAQPPARRRA